MTHARPKAETVGAGLSGLVLLALIVLVAGGELGRGFELSFYLLANVVVFGDVLDASIRFWLRHRNTSSSSAFPCPTSVPLEVGRFTRWQAKMHVRPWAILVSVYDAEEDLDDFLEAIEPVRERVWVIDDGSTDRTVLRLRQAGLNVVEGGVNRKKPGAIRELLATLPEGVETVIVIDPDVSFASLSALDPMGDIERVLFEFQRSGAAAVCPDLVVREDGWLARLQELEYSISLSLGRKSLGDHTVTSGIAIYRRDALASALRRHSLSVYAEDLRNSLLLLEAGERIYYDARLVVQTEGKRDLSAWFSQRVGWFYGLLKVYTEEFPGVWKFTRGRLADRYQFLFYIGVLTILMHPLKIAAVVFLSLSALSGVAVLTGVRLPPWLFVDPAYLLFSWLKYTLLIFVLLFVAVRGQRRSGLLLSVPVYYFYALFHLVPVTVGYVNWISLKTMHRRIYADHYQEELAVREEERRGET